jgi:hypothetical protein
LAPGFKLSKKFARLGISEVRLKRISSKFCHQSFDGDAGHDGDEELRIVDPFVKKGINFFVSKTH